jgi:hypothetical protein
MITELTKEQQDALPKYAAKWIAIRDNTDRFTLEEAIAIIHPFQEKILTMKKTPVRIFDSPISLWKAVQEKFGEKVEFVSCYQDGSFFSHVFGYYDYLIEQNLLVLDAELKQKFDIWKETSKLGLIYPFEDECFVCQKPTKISVNEKNQLHCEDGMAMMYGDWGFYSLNGVTVPEYLVMTPSEDLSMDWYLQQTNADVKAEFVRKYGVERMLELGKKVDSYENYDQEENPWWYKSEYELWDMNVLFDGIPYQPYLKMKNGTTGIWHVEAVSPECTTLELAIKERFGNMDVRIVNIK